MTGTPSKGVRETRAMLAQEVVLLREGTGLSFDMIARQLRLPHRKNAYHYYRAGVTAQVKKHWFKLPLAMRVRWWEGTDYGRTQPRPGLLKDLSDALKEVLK